MGKPNIELKFLFLMCNDCDALREFYENILCLETKGGNKEGWVNVKAGIDLCFFKGDFDLPTDNEWAWQPGYKGGSGHFTSWAIEYDEKMFKKTVEKIDSSDVPFFEVKKPVWRKDSYWAMTVKDPMGNTVEVYYTPKNKPDSLDWR